MLDLGAYAGLTALPALNLSAVANFPDRLRLRALGGDEENRLAVRQLRTLVCTGIAAIAEHALFLAMQQRIGEGDIADIGCRAFQEHQPGEFINADVRLHPEVPLVALAGLMHFRGTCLGGVLGRAGRVDDRGIHDLMAASIGNMTNRRSGRAA